jgi:hypothetical protein
MEHPTRHPTTDTHRLMRDLGRGVRKWWPGNGTLNLGFHAVRNIGSADTLSPRMHLQNLISTNPQYRSRQLEYTAHHQQGAPTAVSDASANPNLSKIPLSFPTVSVPKNTPHRWADTQGQTGPSPMEGCTFQESCSRSETNVETICS